MIDKERLIKLMQLTTSEFDGEALSALRMANRMLKSNGKTWADILSGAPERKEPQFRREYQQQRPPEHPNCRSHTGPIFFKDDQGNIHHSEKDRDDANSRIRAFRERNGKERNHLEEAIKKYNEQFRNTIFEDLFKDILK